MKSPDLENRNVKTANDMAIKNALNTVVVKKIDDFVEHYYNGDLIISDGAFFVPCSFNGKEENLGNCLTAALSNYLIARGNQDPKEIAQSITESITWITQIRGANLITESPSLLSKLKDAEEQNRQLKEENDKLKAEHVRLKQLNEELHRVIERLGPKRTDEDSAFGMNNQ